MPSDLQPGSRSQIRARVTSSCLSHRVTHTHTHAADLTSTPHEAILIYGKKVGTADPATGHVPPNTGTETDRDSKKKHTHLKPGTCLMASKSQPVGQLYRILRLVFFSFLRAKCNKQDSPLEPAQKIMPPCTSKRRTANGDVHLHVSRWEGIMNNYNHKVQANQNSSQSPFPFFRFACFN